MFSSIGILPPIFVLPLAMLTVLVIAGHLAALHADGSVPLSRKRIRTANGIVMLVTTVALAFAFTSTSTSQPRAFAMVWASAVMLLLVVLCLSGLDVLNNLRLARIHRRRMGRAAGDLTRELAQLVRAARERAETEPSPSLTLQPDDPGTDQHDLDDGTGGQAGR